jgi:hypothetical protein
MRAMSDGKPKLAEELGQNVIVIATHPLPKDCF